MVIEWEKIKIELNNFSKRFVFFVDIYNDLNILNQQTFNVIKIRKYENDGNEMFLMTDSEGKIISRFMDFNFILNQLQ